MTPIAELSAGKLIALAVVAVVCVVFIVGFFGLVGRECWLELRAKLSKRRVEINGSVS